MLNQGPFAYLRPVIRGVVRQSPKDFEVEEQLGFVPEEDPTGEHLWLWIEKRGQNTAWAAQALAEAAGLHPSKAGFAGLKDRHAVTRQWISLYLGQRPTPDVDQWAIEGVQVLQVTRSNKKIQRGRLQGNHFCLVLRDLSLIETSNEHSTLDGDLQSDQTTDIQTDLNHRLEQIAQSGVPNFFGEQRFGGNNVGRARRLFAGELRGKRSAPKRGFYLSAARSYLFNEVLAERVREGAWQHLLPGDVALLDGSQSFFTLKAGEENSPEIIKRLGEFDIHPTGPLPGIGEPVVSGPVASLEAACLAKHPDLVTGLEQFKVKAMRRSLRSKVSELQWAWLDDRTLRLEFSLAQGAFATTVLRELIAYEP